MKKIILFLLLGAVLGGGLCAQSNTISGGFALGLSFPIIVFEEAQVSYERQLSPLLSVGVNAAFQLYPLGIFTEFFTGDPNLYGVVFDAQARFYPFGKGFHAELGAGYGYYMWTMHSLVVTLGVGWRFDFGKPGGVILDLGLRMENFVPLGDNIFDSSNGKTRADSSAAGTLIPFNIGPRVSIGYSF
jgi:hypothetical protein